MLESFIFVFVLIVDQVTKYLTEQYLQLGTIYPLWEGVFEFANVHNTGAAWGMLAGGRWLFIIVTIAACIGMLYILFKTRHNLGPVARVCLSLLIAGAIGNLIDRVILGYVRDMLYFSLIDFPVFNIADSAVCIGAGLLVVDTLFVKKGSLFETIEPMLEKKKPPEANTCEYSEALKHEATAPSAVSSAHAVEPNAEDSSIGQI